MNLDDKLKDKDLQNLMKDDLKKETPSSNFTHLVMQKVAEQEIKPALTPAPLVGKMAWILFGVFGLLIGLSLSYSLPLSENFSISIPEFDFTNFEGWYGITLSIIAAVSLLIFADILIRKSKRNTKV